MNFSKILIGMMVLSLALQAQAQVYILKAPQTPIEEFLSFIGTEEVEAYSKKQLSDLRQENTNQKQELITFLEQAQEAFLKEHLKSSSDYFNSIIKMAYSYDWDQESREIIFYSFLRLSQIEHKEDVSKVFLHSAMVFDSTLNPSAKIFPPPFIQKFNQMKANLPQLSVRLNQVFPYHEIVLVNGREVSLADKLNLPYGKYRITALSSSHKKWSQVLSLSELTRQRVVTVNWIRGTCEQAIVPSNLNHHLVLFPDFCVRKKPLSPTQKDQELSRQVLKDTNKPPIKKKVSKWVWITAGVGVGALTWVFVSQNKKEKKPMEPKERSVPTIKVGF